MKPAAPLSQLQCAFGAPSADGVQTFMESRPAEGQVQHRS